EQRNHITLNSGWNQQLFAIDTFGQTTDILAGCRFKFNQIHHLFYQNNAYPSFFLLLNNICKLGNLIFKYIKSLAGVSNLKNNFTVISRHLQLYRILWIASMIL